MNEEEKDTEIEKKVLAEVPEETEMDVSIADDEPKEKKKIKKVDITKLQTVDNGDPIARQRDLKAILYGNRTAFQIVAAQSGYVAKIRPLVNKDIVNILYSNMGRYEYKKNLFQIIYEKIAGFSVGKMSFEEWLRCTSVEDLDTFYYGLYCATFPDEGKLTITCPSCGNAENVRISNLNLTKTTDRKAMKKLIADVSANSISKETMRQYSLINKNDAFELEKSKIVVDIKTPTLWDSLELLRLVPEEVIDKDTTGMTNMLYINKILIPNGKGAYIESSDRQELLRIVDNLSVEDAQDLQAAVSTRMDENRISYSIKNYKCTKCGHTIKEIPLSIEDILFTLIYEKIQ